MRPMKTRAALIPLAVFLVSLAVFSFFRARLVGIRAEGARGTRAFAGDEPSYLLLAHSIVADGDVNLHNNRLERHGRRFGVENCGGHVARKNPAKGEAWSIHTPGFPLLLAPSYALALYSGLAPRALACLSLNLLAALLAVNLWLLCIALVQDRTSPLYCGRPAAALWPPLLCTAAVIFTPPVIYYANLIYPELPASLLVLYAFRQTLRADAHRRNRGSATGISAPSLLISSLAVAFLPWLSFRFIGPAVLLAVFFAAIFLRPSGKRAWGLLLPAALLAFSCALLLRYQRMAFGGWSPAAGYFHQGFERTTFWARGGLNGLLGLALDQAVGMLPWSPVYLLALPGLALLARERPRRGWPLVALILSVYVPEALYMHWWGGYAPPPRYIVVPAPLLGAALCYAVSCATRRSFTVLFALLLPLGLFLGLLGCAYPLTLYRHVHILACFGADISSRVFPSLLHPIRSTWPLAFAWVFFIFSLCAYYLSGRERESRRSGSVGRRVGTGDA